MDPFCVGLDPEVVRLAAEMRQRDDPVAPSPVNLSVDRDAAAVAREIGTVTVVEKKCL